MYDRVNVVERRLLDLVGSTPAPLLEPDDDGLAPLFADPLGSGSDAFDLATRLHGLDRDLKTVGDVTGALSETVARLRERLDSDVRRAVDLEAQRSAAAAGAAASTEGEGTEEAAPALYVGGAAKVGDRVRLTVASLSRITTGEVHSVPAPGDGRRFGILMDEGLGVRYYEGEEFEVLEPAAPPEPVEDWPVRS